MRPLRVGHYSAAVDTVIRFKDEDEAVAADAEADSTAPLAISSGMTGIAGCLPVVSPTPVTAQAINASRFIARSAPLRATATALCAVLVREVVSLVCGGTIVVAAMSLGRNGP